MHFFLVSAIPAVGMLSLVSFDLEAIAMYGLVAFVIGLIAWSKLNEPPLSDPYPQQKSGDDLPGVTGRVLDSGAAEAVAAGPVPAPSQP